MFFSCSYNHNFYNHFFLIRKNACLFAFFLLFFLLSPIKTQARNIPLTSISVDANTGLVIEAKNADTITYPASLTKVMTLYMLFEALEKGWISDNQPLKVSRNASLKPSSKMWLKPNSDISVQDAILAIITRSANDVATVIAESLGEKEENFAKMMTTVAKELGMKSTVFKNASGLHHKEQVTTARDMALLAMAVMQHFPQYYHLFSTLDFEFNNQKYFNHNRLLRTYDGVDGIKTGFINASGFNLMTSAQRGERRVVAVVMGRNSVTQRDKDMAALLDRSFMSLIMAPENVHIPSKKPDLENDNHLEKANKKYNFKPVKKLTE